jgi:triphosphoribosyl-dephospho-CoA synthase
VTSFADEPMGPWWRNSNGLSIGQCVSLACLLEATIPKPGNVHRGADFEDMTFADFAVSAALVGPIFDRELTEPNQDSSVGGLVRSSVVATRNAVGKNTNLGLLLLLGPLASSVHKSGQVTPETVASVLGSITARDCADVYEAIRIAEPGGLGESEEMDVRDPPPSDLLAAMRLAADRDLVARQYANNFADVFQSADDINACVSGAVSLTDAVIHAQLLSLARSPDTLIARKLGGEVARQASDRAAAVLTSGPPGGEDYLRAVSDFDFWLRSDGHRRNPGATADILGAALFVLLWRGGVDLARI